jgi:hypothetical protein
MKQRFPHIRNFCFSVLLLQMINLSLNSVNLYNSGMSGFRHKVTLNSSGMDILIEFISGGISSADGNAEPDKNFNVCAENFDLGFFACMLRLPEPVHTGVIAPAKALFLDVPAHYASLNSPPPRA